MRIHRTTARGAILLSFLLALGLAVVSASLAVNEPEDPPGNGKKPIIFPVVGAGKYFDDCKAVRSSPVSYDENTARELWRISEKMTGVG